MKKLLIIFLVFVALFSYNCTKVDFVNPLDPESPNYDEAWLDDSDGNEIPYAFEDDDKDGVVNYKDPDNPVYQKIHNISSSKSSSIASSKSSSSSESSISSSENSSVVISSSSSSNSSDNSSISISSESSSTPQFEPGHPVITVEGGTEITYAVGDKFKMPTITAYDEEDGPVPVQIIQNDLKDGQLLTEVGTYSIIVVAEDSDGNASTITIFVTVLPGSSSSESSSSSSSSSSTSTSSSSSSSSSTQTGDVINITQQDQEVQLQPGTYTVNINVTFSDPNHTSGTLSFGGGPSQITATVDGETKTDWYVPFYNIPAKGTITVTVDVPCTMKFGW